MLVLDNFLSDTEVTDLQQGIDKAGKAGAFESSITRTGGTGDKPAQIDWRVSKSLWLKASHPLEHVSLLVSVPLVTAHKSLMEQPTSGHLEKHVLGASWI